MSSVETMNSSVQVKSRNLMMRVRLGFVNEAKVEFNFLLRLLSRLRSQRVKCTVSDIE
jgi:hypothetical protein